MKHLLLIAALLVASPALSEDEFVPEFEKGQAVVTKDGKRGTVTDVFESGADGVLSVAVKFDDGTEETFESDPGNPNSDLAGLKVN